MSERTRGAREFVAALGEGAIESTVEGARLWGAVTLSPEEGERGRKASLNKIEEVLDNFSVMGRDGKTGLDRTAMVAQWRDEAVREASQAKAVANSEKREFNEDEYRKEYLLRRVVGAISATDLYIKEKKIRDIPGLAVVASECFPDRGIEELNTSELLFAMRRTGKDKVKETEIRIRLRALEVLAQVSGDLVSEVNRKMPWRLFCELNLQAVKLGSEKKRNPREFNLTTFVGSSTVPDLFQRPNEVIEESAAARWPIRMEADFAMVEAVMDAAELGRKTWNVGAAEKSGKITALEKLLRESTLPDEVSTGMNRGMVWVYENGRLRATEAVRVDPRVVFEDAKGGYKIFRIGEQVGRDRYESDTYSNDERLFRLMEAYGDDPKILMTRLGEEKITHARDTSELTEDKLGEWVADIKSIPTIVIRPDSAAMKERLRRKKGDGTILGSMMALRGALQAEAHFRGMNARMITYRTNFITGDLEIAMINNHSVGDGVEARDFRALLAKRFGVRFRRVIDQLKGREAEANKGSERSQPGPVDMLSPRFLEEDASVVVEKNPDHFLPNGERLGLDIVYPPRGELGEAAGEEVSVAVDVTGLWEVARDFSSLVATMQKEGGELAGEKTLLKSPHFVLEMAIMSIYKSIDPDVGILVAQKGMSDLDLHPFSQGINLRVFNSGSPETKKAMVLAMVESVRGAMAVSKMDSIVKVATVSGPGGRELVNWASTVGPMSEGRQKMGGDRLLSCIPPSDGGKDYQPSTVIDGPAMDPFGVYALTISGMRPYLDKEGKRKMAMVMTMKRNSRAPLTGSSDRRGFGSNNPNVLAHEYIDAVAVQVKGLSRTLASLRKPSPVS